MVPQRVLLKAFNDLKLIFILMRLSEMHRAGSVKAPVGVEIGVSQLFKSFMRCKNVRILS